MTSDEIKLIYLSLVTYHLSLLLCYAPPHENFSDAMAEAGATYSPLYENLDTSYVNLAALLRYLQRQNFAGSVRVDLEEYEAQVWLRPGEKPRAREKDRATGRESEGEDALQRLIVRATAPGGSISIYKETEEEEARAAQHERTEASQDDEEDEWLALLRACGDLIAAVERACLSAGADFQKVFREISFELSDDYPFLDPSVNGFSYSHGAIEISGSHNKSAVLGAIVEALRRTVNRVAVGSRERSTRERVALELAVLARRREAQLARFQLLNHLDRIAGTRVM